MVLLEPANLLMIEYKKGDILREDVEALVNTVNCVGIMGRGIALQFKNAFPEILSLTLLPVSVTRCDRVKCWFSKLVD